MPREPYAKIWKKAERRWGGDMLAVARPTRFLRKLFECVKFERDFGKYLARSLEGKWKFHLEREKRKIQIGRNLSSGLRDEPMSEKHYALFMSSLSARSRELLLWIDPFRNDITCVLYYIRRLIEILTVNSTAGGVEIVTRAPFSSSTLATCALCRSLIYARSSTCMGHLSQFVRLYWRYMLLLRYFRAMLNTKGGGITSSRVRKEERQSAGEEVSQTFISKFLPLEECFFRGKRFWT